MELFRTFKKFDRNQNGTLSFSEYTACLTETPKIELSKQEIITVAMSADTNGDGVIDFEEFMKHFPDILNCIQFQNNLDSTYERVKA
jgi:Ca2+-binding EF-hand superfamily protein